MNLFIISGPSGAGEDSVIKKLDKIFGVNVVITTTTRSPRDGESEGNPYYFISSEEFEIGINKGNYLEWAQHYNGQYYGVTKTELTRVQNAGGIGIWKIDYKGVEKAKKLFPEIIAIFLMTPDLATLERRIRGRSNASEQYVQERMAYTKEWLKHIDLYDYTVINSDGALNTAVNEIATIIRSHNDK